MDKTEEKGGTEEAEATLKKWQEDKEETYRRLEAGRQYLARTGLTTTQRATAADLYSNLLGHYHTLCSLLQVKPKPLAPLSEADIQLAMQVLLKRFGGPQGERNKIRH